MPVEMIMDESEPPASAGGQISEYERQILTDSGFCWRERDGLKVLVCRPLEDAGFVNAFSTRLGGVSDFPKDSLNLAGFDEDLAENIYENRRRFLNTIGGEFKLATAWQVHGDGVKIVKDQSDVDNSEERFDGLVSQMSDVFVGVKTADCVPVLIGDRGKKAFAAIHAGWRGTVSSIVVRAIEKLQSEFGSEPTDMIAAIGPAAGCGNYEIGNDVIEAFAEKFDGSEKYFNATRKGHALVDLHLANKDQLLSCGVPLDAIYTAPYCTMERPDLFFSYRLEKKKFGKTGRLLSVIGRR
ncbi:MAG: peptidoglycan editing factor PgeF [Pyrinomonadaceae bacterium]